MNQSKKYDAIIIGGGFFGCKVAIYLKKYLKNIIILEKEADLLQRASYANQARVHHGYHYPRSILTAWRSKINFPKFVNEYRECIFSDFTNYYAIGKKFSKINLSQFKNFCKLIAIPLTPAQPSIKNLFNSHLIEEVFYTKEYVFDALKLKNRIYEELESAAIEVKLQTEATHLDYRADSQEIEIILNSKIGLSSLKTKYIFNCTYSSLNRILSASDLPIIPLKHEFAEMALVDVPPLLKNLGITVMCGPFFSLMPFPSQHLHTLSHVRYTPTYYWQDTASCVSSTEQIYHQYKPQTNYPYMIRDGTRYLSILQDCVYINSLWVIKTTLPQSEVDDSRPILFNRNPSLPNLISVLGGKIDNVYDIPAELQFLQNEDMIA